MSLIIVLPFVQVRLGYGKYCSKRISKQEWVGSCPEQNVSGFIDQLRNWQQPCLFLFLSFCMCLYLCCVHVYHMCVNFTGCFLCVGILSPSCKILSG